MSSGDLPPAVTLDRVLEVVGESLLKPLSLPRGADVTVSDVSVYDPGDIVPATGQILLAVGIDPADSTAWELPAQCRAAGAPVMVIKDRGGDLTSFLARSGSEGVAVLSTPVDADWAHLVTTLRAALVSAGMRPAGVLSAVPLGDLFSLANTIADMAGGPVTIEDPHSRVLAFSHTNDAADEPRRLSILGRQVPSAWVTDLRTMGVFARLWSDHKPVEVPALPEHGMTGRLAIAVRSGQEVLGSIWLARGGEPLPAHAAAALEEAARASVVHLLGYARRDASPVEAASRTVRSFLEGRTTAKVLARTLELEDRLVTLAALAPRDPVPGPDTEILGRRLANLAVAYTQVRGIRAGATVTADGQALLVLGLPTATQPRLKQLLEDLASRATSALHTDVVAACARLLDRPEELSAQRPVLDQVLNVLRQRTPELKAATPDEVHAPMLLGEVDRLLEQHPELQTGPVHQLAEFDENHGTQYLPTLRAFLATFGEVRAAAQSVQVHPNTFRYRLRRIAEMTGLSLDEPDERLAAALQLRYLMARGRRRRWPARTVSPAG